MRPDLQHALRNLTDEDRTELLAALLHGDLGGSEGWADAIYPVEKAFVAAYPTIIRNQEWREYA